MAGSFSHVAQFRQNKLVFRGMKLIENMRDAAEAIEEMFDIIEYLYDQSHHKLVEAHKWHCLKRNGRWDNAQWNTSEYLLPEDEEDV